MRQRGTAWLLVGSIVLLLGTCGPTQPSATSSPAAPAITVLSGSIAVRANSSWVIFSNNTYRDIFIPAPGHAAHGEKTFRFYKKTTTGWARLHPFNSGVLGTWMAHDPGIPIPSDSHANLRIAHTLGAYWPFWMGESEGEYLVQIRYQWGEQAPPNELVQYSNTFTICCPTETVGTINVAVELKDLPSLTFRVENNSPQSLWFPGPCPYLPGISSFGWGVLGDSEFNDDGYLTLQHQTDEGTWEIIRAERSACTWTEPFQIVSGEDIVVDAEQWFDSEIAICGPGIYRWDVAFYMDNRQSPSGEYYTLDEVRHILSEPFQVGE